MPLELHRFSKRPVRQLGLAGLFACAIPIQASALPVEREGQIQAMTVQRQGVGAFDATVSITLDVRYWYSARALLGAPVINCSTRVINARGSVEFSWQGERHNLQIGRGDTDVIRFTNVDLLASKFGNPIATLRCNAGIPGDETTEPFNAPSNPGLDALYCQGYRSLDALPARLDRHWCESSGSVAAAFGTPFMPPDAARRLFSDSDAHRNAMISVGAIDFSLSIDPATMVEEPDGREDLSLTERIRQRLETPSIVAAEDAPDSEKELAEDREAERDDSARDMAAREPEHTEEWPVARETVPDEIEGARTEEAPEPPRPVLVFGDVTPPRDEIAEAETAEGTDPRCYDQQNLRTVGEATWTGCAGMLIVSEAMLRDAKPGCRSHDTVHTIEAHGRSFSLADGPDTVFTGQVRNMRDLFSSCSDFNEDISHWDTSNVTNMRGMLANAHAFNQDIGNWDTSRVENMRAMFWHAHSFNQDIGACDTGRVRNMHSMFTRAHSFDQDIGNWDTGRVETMRSMFSDTRSFNQDIGNWDVSQVEYMNSMFSRTSAFDQDIRRWDTSSVRVFRSMFLEAEAFRQDLSQWCVKSVEDRGYMYFDLMSNLTDRQLPDWQSGGRCQ